jgi:hypothetical protein
MLLVGLVRTAAGWNPYHDAGLFGRRISFFGKLLAVAKIGRIFVDLLVYLL